MHMVMNSTQIDSISTEIQIHQTRLCFSSYPILVSLCPLQPLIAVGRVEHSVVLSTPRFDKLCILRYTVVIWVIWICTFSLDLSHQYAHWMFFIFYTILSKLRLDCCQWQRICACGSVSIMLYLELNVIVSRLTRIPTITYWYIFLRDHSFYS